MEKRHLERPYDACSEFEVKESREIMHISDFARKAIQKLTQQNTIPQTIPKRCLQKSHAKPRRELTAPHIKQLIRYQLYATISSKHQKLKSQIQKLLYINHQ